MSEPSTGAGLSSVAPEIDIAIAAAEIERLRDRARVADSIANTARHLLDQCKLLMHHSHDRRQICDAAALTLEATRFASSATQTKAGAMARLSGTGDKP